MLDTMGLDINGYNLLRYLIQRHDLGEVATIGRQDLYVSDDVRRRHQVPDSDLFCETLVQALGARSVESFDVSDFEGATHVVDLSEPYLPEKQYQTVLDFGSLEHIYNQGNAFDNMRRLVRAGGIVSHILPVNNLNGHGFWQYSSDLMHEVYSPENGFSECEVFYLSGLDPRYWYVAPRSRPGEKLEVISIEPIQLISIARRSSDALQPAKVFQPFFKQNWADQSQVAARAVSSLTRRLGRSLKAISPQAVRILRNVHAGMTLAMGRNAMGLSSLKRVTVRELI